MAQRLGTEYAALFHAVPDAVVCADTDGRITQTNKAFADVFGYRDGELVGQSTQVLYFENESTAKGSVNPFRFRLTSRREATVVEYRRKDGEVFLGETTSSTVTDGESRTVGFLSIIRDISEEVRLREAQILAEQELQKSEQLLRASGRLASVGGWELAVDDRQMQWSDEIYHMLELDEHCEPTLDLALSFFTPDAREVMKRASARAIERGVSYDLELPMLTSSGEQRWVRAIGKPHFEQGRITRLTGVLQDITRSKQAEQAKREFISVVSHELRTPLTSIRGALGLLSGGVAGDLPGKADDLVQIASKNSERLGDLINDILDIEKIEAGKISLNTVTIDLEAMLEEIVVSHRAFADSLGVELRVRVGEGASVVRADESRLEQVLTNLLSNAVKFSPRGGTVVLRLDASPRKGFSRISVSDRGPGISDDFKPLVFEKFAQADASDSRRVSGTGLGLSITKALTERMGGYIGYRTRAGMGTMFFVDFPNASRNRRDVVASERPPSLGRVLVCEDDPDIARILQLSLNEEAKFVDIAPNAERALEMLEQGDYDAMTVDLRLPGRGGLALIRDVSLRPEFADLAIVVVSANAEESRAGQNDVSLGIVDWIQKPVDHVRLKQALRSNNRPEPASPRPTVLHVEDDRDVVEVTRRLIEDLADTMAAANREEACELIRQTDFDLVILDMVLPDGSGLDVLEALEAASKTSVPVVVFSVYPRSADVLGHVAAQLVKSKVTNEDLRETVRSLLVV